MHAERKKVEVLAAKKKISERAHEIQQERSTLELDFESARPLLLDAQSALASVSKDELLHLGSQKSQTLLVRHVLDMVLIVLRYKLRPIEMQDARSYRDSFTFAIEVLSAPECHELLQEVECDSMNGETAELLAPYFRHKDFNPEKLNSVSVQAASTQDQCGQPGSDQVQSDCCRARQPAGSDNTSRPQAAFQTGT